MPGRIPDPRIKDLSALDSLRDGGASYEDWSVDRLRHRAAELDIPGRSRMRKDELIAALRRR